MTEHPIAAVACIMSGVFGAIFLLSFVVPFDYNDILLRVAEKNKLQQKTSWSEEYKAVWAETRGMRFLVPLGVVLCLVSLTTYLVWLN